MIDKNLWLFGQEKNLSALMTEANGREANNVSQRPCAQSKIQQTKMLFTCQRFGDLFLFGLVWQYSSVQTKYNKGRFKVMATYLQQ